MQDFEKYSKDFENSKRLYTLNHVKFLIAIAIEGVCILNAVRFVITKSKCLACCIIKFAFNHISVRNLSKESKKLSDMKNVS